jgi:ectoine hydroxylase-related dioxygenase (phytanoyl-CoA dioxygenase family)
MHQDTIHLSNFPSGQMCGVWIALEDIRAGSGELAYYRGSHRWPRIFMRDLGLDKIDPAQPDWATFGEAYRTATQRLEAEHAVSAESFLARAHAVSTRTSPAIRW